MAGYPLRQVRLKNISCCYIFFCPFDDIHIFLFFHFIVNIYFSIVPEVLSSETVQPGQSLLFS